MVNTKLLKLVKNKISIIHFILTVFCWFYANLNFAQNLVPNPSFEQLIECPTNLGASYTPIQRFCNDWESVGIKGGFMSGGGGQYLHECANAQYDLCGLPQSIFSYQYAHSGKAVAQIANTYDGFEQLRLFYGSRLLKPLIIGRSYTISFYIVLADSSTAAMNNIGVTLFTQKTKMEDVSTISSLIYPNRAHVNSDKIIDDKVNWIKIEGTIVADSNYSYLVVGNFFDYNKTTYKNLGGLPSIRYPFYLLDDFTVEETRKTIVPTNYLICEGDSINLNAQGSSQNFFWSYNKRDTLSTEPTIFIKTDNDITIYLLSPNNIDSINLKVIKPPIKILPLTATICDSQQITLNASVPFGKYLWNSGETGENLQVNIPGKYMLKTITGTCSRFDTIDVSICSTTIFAPNAFTPNSDGLNDVFLPIVAQCYDYSLRIYNQWGKLIFTSNDSSIGWDGSDAFSGVYVYVTSCSDFSRSKSYSKTGTITLLK